MWISDSWSGIQWVQTSKMYKLYIVIILWSECTNHPLLFIKEILPFLNLSIYLYKCAYPPSTPTSLFIQLLHSINNLYWFNTFWIEKTYNCSHFFLGIIRQRSTYFKSTLNNYKPYILLLSIFHWTIYEVTLWSRKSCKIFDW